MDTKLEDLKLWPSLLRELNQTGYEVVGDMQHLPPAVGARAIPQLDEALMTLRAPSALLDVAASYGAGTEKDAATRSASAEGEMNEPTRSLRAEIVALPATRIKPAAAQMVPEVLGLSQEKQRSGKMEWSAAVVRHVQLFASRNSEGENNLLK